MYYRLDTQGTQYDFQSTAATLADLKTELSTETVGVMSDNQIIGIDLVRLGIISVAPSPPNEAEGPLP